LHNFWWILSSRVKGCNSCWWTVWPANHPFSSQSWWWWISGSITQPGNSSGSYDYDWHKKMVLTFTPYCCRRNSLRRNCFWSCFSLMIRIQMATTFLFQLPNMSAYILPIFCHVIASSSVRGHVTWVGKKKSIKSGIKNKERNEREQNIKHDQPKQRHEKSLKNISLFFLTPNFHENVTDWGSKWIRDPIWSINKI